MTKKGQSPFFIFRHLHLKWRINYDNFFHVRVALAQISPHLGDVRRNLDLHLNYIEKAKKKKADLLIFPELSLTGYTLMDMVPEVALVPGKDAIFRKLKAASQEISLVIGFVEELEKGIKKAFAKRIFQ